MTLPVVLALVWAAVLIVVYSLCLAAARGDRKEP